jgi:hypothetical protein
MPRARVALAVVAALVAVAPARADEPPAPANAPATTTPDADTAKAHYEKAQQLYATGDYDEAIAEYQDAYRLKPHPNVLYNIAQAYERLLDYAQSVTWFERYLAEAPKDAPERPIVQNRLRILRNLPARVSVSTIPEHVHAAVVDGAGKRREAETPALFKLSAGAYTLELAQPGWEAEAHDLAVEIGQPYFYQYRLKRSTAQVSIFTRPRGARVFIDERLVGETPFAGTLDVGRHKLLLEHKDYPWHREDLDVKPGKPIQREVTLTRPIRSGRVELVIASMVFGGAAGPLLVASVVGPCPANTSCFANSGTGLLVYLLSAGAGLGAGFLGSFLSTRDGIKVGYSSLMIGSAVWGTSIATGLSLGLDIKTNFVYGLAIAGSGIGMTAGFLIARKLDISAGDAALVNTGGGWGTATGVLLAQSIFRNPSGSQFGWFMLGGTTAGLLTGSLLSWKLELSRGRVGLIDVGGLAGTGLGFALGYVIGYNSKSEDDIQTGARYALGGMALGLLAGAVLTRKYKGDLPPVEALLRREGGGRWAFGLPAFNVEQAQTAPGSFVPRFSVTLAKGSW